MEPGGAVAPLILFVDRDTWSYRLDERLRAAGIAFVAHRDLFADDTPDIEWLPEVGRRGYVVVTRDQQIRRRHNELAAVRRAGLHLFALTSGNLSAEETAALITKAWPAIARAVALTSPPALWSITRTASVTLIKQ